MTDCASESMGIARLLGWICIVLAAAAMAHDLWLWTDGAPVAALTSLWAGEPPPFHLSVFGELWFMLHPESLQLTQPAIERHLVPWLWDPVLINVLLAPASISLAVLGVVLLLLSGLRRRRFRFRSR